MIKIGIVTNYTYTNYGSVLQSYALQTKLKEFGYECENIRYSYGSIPKKRIEFINKIFLTIWNIRDYIKGGRSGTFYKFRKRYIKESKFLYQSIQILKHKNLDYDMLICGSDQIWNPNQYNEWYFLTFAKPGIRKIAYAPSFGVKKLPDKFKKVIKKHLESFHCLSVREKTGSYIVYELNGLKPTVVLDPTLLLDRLEWMKIRRKVKVRKKYVFCYFLGDNKSQNDVVRRFCDKYKLLMISPFNKENLFKSDLMLKRVGPREFISLIDNADFVFTDSLHGTLFSIIFKKQFVSFLRFASNNLASENNRLIDFLNDCKLNDRLIKDVSFEKVVECMNADIHYDAIDIFLEEKKLISIDYLKKSLI